MLLFSTTSIYTVAPSSPHPPSLSLSLSGQLGIAHNYTEITRPRQVLTPSGHHIAQIACGANFSAALSSER